MFSWGRFLQQQLKRSYVMHPLSAGCVGLCFLFVFCVNCTVAQIYFPTNDANWQTTTAQAAGADPLQLQAAIDFAGSNNTHALVILHQGKILTEEYWNSWDRTTQGPSYSAAKSVVSVLIGQAIEQGLMEGVQQPSADFLTEWEGDAARENILIKDHLSMTTGFKESPATLLLLQASKNERRFGTQQDIEHPPGTSWYYNDAAYRLLFYMIEEASGETLPEFSARSLFDVINMSSTEWVVREETVLGQPVYNYQWLNFSALDAARFGLLALSDGNWDGTQVVSSGWMTDSTTAQYSFAPWYGRLWWLNSAKNHELPGQDDLRHGPFAPDAPPDMFAALGAFDQKIYVIPSMSLVVVRLGTQAAESDLAVGVFDNLLLGKICRAFGYAGQPQHLELTASVQTNQVSVQFPTWNGRQYTLMNSSNLTNWVPVAGHTNILGNGTVSTYSTVPNQHEFFKTDSWFEAE